METRKAKDILLKEGYFIINKKLVKILGLEETFLLINLIEGENLLKTKNGWFFQTFKFLEELTGLSRRKQEKAINKLVEIGIIMKKNMGVPCKRYFKINMERLEEVLKEDKRDFKIIVEEPEIKKVLKVEELKKSKEQEEVKRMDLLEEEKLESEEILEENEEEIKAIEGQGEIKRIDLLAEDESESKVMLEENEKEIKKSKEQAEIKVDLLEEEKLENKVMLEEYVEELKTTEVKEELKGVVLLKEEKSEDLREEELKVNKQKEELIKKILSLREKEENKDLSRVEELKIDKNLESSDRLEKDLEVNIKEGKEKTIEFSLEESLLKENSDFSKEDEKVKAEFYNHNNAEKNKQVCSKSTNNLEENRDFPKEDEKVKAEFYNYNKVEKNKQVCSKDTNNLLPKDKQVCSKSTNKLDQNSIKDCTNCTDSLYIMTNRDCTNCTNKLDISVQTYKEININNLNKKINIKIDRSEGSLEENKKEYSAKASSIDQNFKNNILNFKKIIANSTKISMDKIDNLIFSIISILKKYDITILIEKIKESDFLMGKLEIKPRITNFTRKNMLDRIMADEYKNRDYHREEKRIDYGKKEREDCQATERLYKFMGLI